MVFSRPVNLGTHACHLHGLGLKDKEGTFFDLLALALHFNWLQKPLEKFPNVFVFTRGNLRLLLSAMGQKGKNPHPQILKLCPCLSEPPVPSHTHKLKIRPKYQFQLSH